jgi:signal transduction histidine kinase
MFLYVIAVFCLVYGIADLVLGQYQQAGVMLITIISSGVSYFFYLKKKFFLSKIWNMATLTAIIFIIIVQTGTDSFVFIYYIPLLMGNLFIFYGREIIAGYIIIVLNVLIMVGSFLCLDKFIELPRMSQEMIELDGLMNLIGVSIICFAETFFIVKVSNTISKKYVEKTRALSLKNEQLMSTLYTRDRMMAVLSHDLRSPVASLDSAADILQTDGIEPEMQKAILGQFKGRTSSLLDLIDKLLLWTRTQTNNIEYKEQPIKLSEIQDMVSNICDLSTSEKSVRYELNFGSFATSNVLGDKDMLETVFRNLISNATKYSKENSVVQITAQQTPQGWCFRVIDFGVGMSQDFLSKMNSGEVLSTRGTKNEVGHGLGLQLVNDFLNKHSSHLMVSTLEGKGSEFYFYLKAA